LVECRAGWDELKENAIKSCRAWREAEKPRYGPLNDNYRKDKLLYKKRLKEEQGRETSAFTNDLHEALLCKSGTDFWKVWKSKFGGNISSRVIQVDGTSNCGEIANIFAKSFEKNVHSVYRCSQRGVKGCLRQQEDFIQRTSCSYRPCFYSRIVKQTVGPDEKWESRRTR